MSKKYFSSRMLKIILVLVICVSFIFLSPNKFFHPSQGFFLKISYPFQRISYSFSKKIGDFFNTISSISDFRSENENLIKENNSLSAELANLREQKKENEELRKQLKLSPRGVYDLEAAFIIGQNPYGQGSWIIIDKGEDDGIKVGMPAIVYEGILVGKVDEVFKDTSKIVLLTDPFSKINVQNSETGAKGILSGEYSLGLQMSMVERTSVLNVGDNIITSGLGGSIPKGFLIGKIGQIRNTEDKLFQEAIVIPKIKYFDLEIVFVVKGVN